jgi:hypothetical protein
MTAQTEFTGKIFDQVFDAFRKAGESTLRLQQEMFRQWAEGWGGAGKPPAWPEQAQKVQKEWAQAVADITRRYQESWEAQYKAGLQHLQEAFKVPGSADPEELRKITEELWRRTFDYLRELGQAQVRDFQAAVEKWFQLMKPPAAA